MTKDRTSGKKQATENTDTENSSFSRKRNRNKYNINQCPHAPFDPSVS